MVELDLWNLQKRIVVRDVVGFHKEFTVLPAYYLFNLLCLMFVSTFLFSRQIRFNLKNIFKSNLKAFFASIKFGVTFFYFA